MSAAIEKQAITSKVFHQYIHKNIGTPKVHYKSNDEGDLMQMPRHHCCEWAESLVILKQKTILIKVYIDFHKQALSATEYSKLKILAKMGIQQYWSRAINIAEQSFNVVTQVVDRKGRSIDVNLKISDKKGYARSHNSGILRATFIYNSGFYKSKPFLADKVFKHLSAHEFGHSVLQYFGGTTLSWGHKGSTGVLSQKVKTTTPGYPATGEIDLILYYKANEVSNIFARTSASSVDVMRLIWMSDIHFKQTS